MDLSDLLRYIEAELWAWNESAQLANDGIAADRKELETSLQEIDTLCSIYLRVVGHPESFLVTPKSAGQTAKRYRSDESDV